MEQIVLNHIYNENCIDTLSRVTDDFFNLVITSPPYNMNLRIRGGKYCSRQIVKEFSTKYEGFDDNLPIDEYFEFHKKILSELLRVSSIVFYNIQIVTGSKKAFFKIIGHFADQLKDIIVWDKGVAQPAMQYGVLNRQSELLLVFDKKNAISRKFDKCFFERGTLNDIWRIKKGKKISENHGASFPEELVHTILKNFSKENDVVYDPFMGTGTTAYVCKTLRRNFVGSELSQKYCEVANQRLLQNNIL